VLGVIEVLEGEGRGGMWLDANGVERERAQTWKEVAGSNRWP